eukprot:7896553-Pyramimonas_sp.AAC.1
MTVLRWVAHRCGRASARGPARGTANYFGATGVAAVVVKAGRFPARVAGRADAWALQCESVTRAA